MGVHVAMHQRRLNAVAAARQVVATVGLCRVPAVGVLGGDFTQLFQA